MAISLKDLFFKNPSYSLATFYSQEKWDELVPFLANCFPKKKGFLQQNIPFFQQKFIVV
jgi:hypothetical protein